MMNYSLDPLKIKLEIEEDKERYKAEAELVDYKAVASYKIFMNSYSKIVKAESGIYTSKDKAIKDAIEKLEWEVYRYKLEHNKYNELDYAL